MSRILATLAVLLAMLASSSCATRNPYKVSQQKDEHTSIPLRAIVPDLEDSRGFEQYNNRTLAMIPIVGFRAGYYYDRHDDIYSGITEPFPRLVARKLAERLDEVGVFDKVTAVEPDKMTAPGDYDLIVKGRIIRMRSVGGVWRYGLSIFGDLLWSVGLPYLSRAWEIEIEYSLVDAYTGKAITSPDIIKIETGSTMFTRYVNRGKTTDLERKLTPALDGFIDALWRKAPAGTDKSWAQLRESGTDLLAARKREEELAKQGTPPTFQFIAPLEGATIRTAQVPVRWSIAAPGGLKSASLNANSTAVDLGLNAASLSRESESPRSLPVTETMVPLRMGENTLQASVTDHRGNETQATVRLNRLPAELRPKERFALLISAGGTQGVEDLKAALVDPAAGQFAPEAVTVVNPATLTRAAIEDAIRAFGARPLTGNLAVVYLAVPANWSDLAIGDGSMKLDEFIATLSASLATSEVVLLTDINWSGTEGDQDLMDRLTDVPSRWAVLFTQRKGGPSADHLLAGVVTSLIKGADGSTRRLTLERLLDGIINDLETKSAGVLKPESYGRFEPSLTMAERE